MEGASRAATVLFLFNRAVKDSTSATANIFLVAEGFHCHCLRMVIRSLGALLMVLEVAVTCSFHVLYFEVMGHIASLIFSDNPHPHYID